MNNLDRFYGESKSFSDFTWKYFNHLHNLLNSVDTKALQNFIDILLASRDNNTTVFLVGNGGSAMTAAHFVNDLCKTTKRKERNFKAMNLSDNVSWLTALANDEGYEHVFSGQLGNFIQKDDVVIGISASGNSKNVIKALELANEKGAISVAMVGFDGGRMKEVAKEYIHIHTGLGEYGPVEDVHMVLVHLITIYVSFLSKDASFQRIKV